LRGVSLPAHFHPWTPIDRNHGIYRERDSQGVEK
jgi:hypothetical protein